MRQALFAGGTFAGFVLVGFLAGLAASRLTHLPALVIVGLFAGVLGGSIAAMRALLEAGK